MRLSLATRSTPGPSLPLRPWQGKRPALSSALEAMSHDVITHFLLVTSWQRQCPVLWRHPWRQPFLPAMAVQRQASPYDILSGPKRPLLTSSSAGKPSPTEKMPPPVTSSLRQSHLAGRTAGARLEAPPSVSSLDQGPLSMTSSQDSPPACDATTREGALPDDII